MKAKFEKDIQDYKKDEEINIIDIKEIIHKTDIKLYIRILFINKNGKIDCIESTPSDINNTLTFIV